MQTLNQWPRKIVLLGTAVVLMAWQSPVVHGQNQRPTARPDNNDPIFRVTSAKSELKIVERFAKVVDLSARISTVYGFDPEVISVTKVDLRPNQIRVHGTAPGVTSLVLVDENNEIHTLEVFVTGDVRHLQAYINRLFPRASVQAVAVRDSVVLRGWVMQPEHITELVEIAEQFYPRVLNQMKVGGVQQVQLRVRIMEVQRSRIRRLGINFLYMDENGFLGSTPGALTPIAALVAPLGGPAALTATASRLSDASIVGGILNDSFSFQSFIQALKEESLLKILAEPELVTTNGRPANMLAGGEFPILVPQSLGTTTIEWREFGVRLEAVPIILGNGRVRLELQPEVSERDFTNAVNINGLLVPGLTTRRVNTQVEMKFGETFMLAGLLSMRRTATTSKLPFLGELPLIGAAFRRVRYDDAETELVIMVTPELAAPQDSSQIPPGGPGDFTDIPTDRELYRDGMIEVPKYGDWCEDCGPSNLNPLPSRIAPSGHFPGRMGDGHTPVPPPAPAAPARIPGNNPGTAGLYSPRPNGLRTGSATPSAITPSAAVMPDHRPNSYVKRAGFLNPLARLGRFRKDHFGGTTPFLRSGKSAPSSFGNSRMLPSSRNSGSSKLGLRTRSSSGNQQRLKRNGPGLIAPGSSLIRPSRTASRTSGLIGPGN